MSSTSESASTTRWNSRQAQAKPLIRVLVRILLIAGLAGLGWLLFSSIGHWIFEDVEKSEGATYKVVRRAITDSVIERGTLESQNTIEGRCNLPGWENKIIYIVPEGSLVKEGDVVVRFDSSAVDRTIAENQAKLIEAEGKLEQAKQALEVQNNKNESDIAAAELELVLAELDLKKYRDGDYIAETADMERSISVSEAELKKASEELTNMRILVRKGFRSPEQLRELEFRVSAFESQFERDKQKFRVLTEYDHIRKITEFEAKAREAQRKLARAKTTADAETKKMESQVSSAQSEVELVKRSLEERMKDKQNCEIIAPSVGTVAYANQEWYDDSRRIREGTSVRQQQGVFYLPDMSKMQVKVNVHESVVNKIKKQMPVSVRVDAYPDTPLRGRVSFVAELAASSFGTAKNYEVVALIDSIPETMRIKPGMTAQTEIFVGRYENILCVPLGAITEHHQSTYIYVQEGLGNTNRRIVTTGRSTHSYIEITEGITENDLVMLDAYQRGLKDFGESERDNTATEFDQMPEPDPELVSAIETEETLVVDSAETTKPAESDLNQADQGKEAAEAAEAAIETGGPKIENPQSFPAIDDKPVQDSKEIPKSTDSPINGYGSVCWPGLFVGVC